ncbi:MAG: DUF1922 domain-containing protein [Candidatus Ranarchaeia archaeon]
MPEFLVFRCPRCGHYLNAPSSQKTRLCSYCRRVVKVDRERAQLVKNARDAGELVRRYNAGNEIEKFQVAAHTFRGKQNGNTRTAILNRNNDKTALDEATTGSQRLLLHILHEHASKQAIDFEKMRSLSLRYDLPWDWTKSQIETLAKNGDIVFPKPWSIQYIVKTYSVPGHRLATRPKKKKKIRSSSLLETSKSTLRNRIRNYIASVSGTASIQDIVNALGVNNVAEIEDALAALLHQGFIFEPSPGRYKQVG